MSLLADCKTLYHLVCAPIAGGTQAERLENFYRGQAPVYDDFRARLLPGRPELMSRLDVPAGGVWVDLGGGTGANLELAGDSVARCRSVWVVDLAPSLLQVARERIARRGWRHVHAVEADALTFQPPLRADLVTLSYSLTMMPDWFAAVDRACELLAPGGLIGVTDFFVSRKFVEPKSVRHSWFTRHVLPAWFSRDNVFLNSDHAPYLLRRFETLHYSEHDARIPYLPLVRAPYYVYVGRRRA